MSVMKRLSGIVQAKANKALDKAENPADMLDLSYEKQMENLTKVRRALADVATARKRLELQASQLQTQAQKLQDQAKQALGQGQEDLARQALARRAALATNSRTWGPSTTRSRPSNSSSRPPPRACRRRSTPSGPRRRR